MVQNFSFKKKILSFSEFNDFVKTSDKTVNILKPGGIEISLKHKIHILVHKLFKKACLLCSIIFVFNLKL